VCSTRTASLGFSPGEPPPNASTRRPIVAVTAHACGLSAPPPLTSALCDHLKCAMSARRVQIVWKGEPSIARPSSSM
jgi:hypothetical protein